MSDREMVIEVGEVGLPDTVLQVPIGLNVRPVFVVEFFPEDPYAQGGRICVTHGGWDGEVRDFRTAAEVLREAAGTLERAALLNEGE